MKNLATLLTVITLVIGFVTPGLGQVPSELIVYPELLIHNGKIVTVDDKTTSTDPGTMVEALAVRGSKILALGDDDQILALRGPQTQVIDLEGRTVVPGIIDTHSHLQSYAINHFGWREIAKRRVSIPAEPNESWDSVKTKTLVRIEELAAERQAGEWIAVNWPRTALDEKGKPAAGLHMAARALVTRAELDQIAPRHPVYIAAGVGAVTNSRAQAILRERWYGSEEPGLMEESGFSSNTINKAMVDFLIPDLETITEIYKQENWEWAGFGVTTWSSSVRSLRVLASYQLLDKRGEMGIRLAYAPAAGTPVQVIPEMMGVGDYGSDYLWPVGSARRGLDNSYPAIYTSLQPPSVRPEIKERETVVISTPAYAETYRQFMEDSIAQGHRYANTHTSGDLTLDLTLDAIEKGSTRAGLSPQEIRAKRHVIDHCTMSPRPDQIPRIERLGIIMSCGAKYVEASPRILSDYGEEYLNWVSPVKSLMDAGVRTVLEIDTHEIAEHGTVFHYLDLLVNREVGGQFYAGKEKVDRVQALKMATIWAAEYVLRENALGSLEKGKFADFIVLDKDYMTVEPLQIRTIQVLLTVVGGNIVYQSESL